MRTTRLISHRSASWALNHFGAKARLFVYTTEAVAQVFDCSVQVARGDEEPVLALAPGDARSLAAALIDRANLAEGVAPHCPPVNAELVERSSGRDVHFLAASDDGSATASS